MITTGRDIERPLYPPMVPIILQKALLDFKSRKKSLKLIDLGCGSGSVLEAIGKDGLLEEVEIFGVDINPMAIAEFKKRFPSAKTIVGDLSNLKSFAKNYFDFAVCNQVIEHLVDDKAAIWEIHRLLKIDGFLYIASVIKKWYGIYWYRNKFGQIVVDPNHVREYGSAKEFYRLLTAKGFLIKEREITAGRLPLVDYFCRFLLKIGFLKFTDIRDYYARHAMIYRLSQVLTLPLPGYAIIEVLAKRGKND